MSDPRPTLPLIRALAQEAAELTGVEVPSVPLAPPANAEHGDLASPLAMTLAKAARRRPREIAADLAERLGAREELADLVAGVHVAGPGFLNITLAPVWFAVAARQIAAAGTGYGAGSSSANERILLEFVSANPTGPPHVGHARQAAYGDSLARILAFVGHQVEREYYVNDHGRQIELFGRSIGARFGDLPVPEDGYLGDYVKDLAERIREEVGDRFDGDLDPLTPEALEHFTRRGKDLMLAAIKTDLDRFRASFDAYFSETDLHASGGVSRGVDALVVAGDAYEDDGALWFRSSSYGDEKDRVLVRSGGATTYLAADVAYHLEKAARGHDRLIDILGADHHGYIARLRAVLAAGGHDPERLEVLIVQLVSLVEGGQAKRMSKRAGTLVSLADLLDDVGVDAARFFLVQRSHETPLDLDLDLAREQNQENPVYYVQYAHARIAGILRGRPAPAGTAGDIPPPETLDASERALVLRLIEWPEAVAEAAERRAPHRVAAYLRDLAADFHGFYHRCRVVGEEPPVEAFRLDCCRAAASVLRAGLDLLGVEAPERM